MKKITVVVPTIRPNSFQLWLDEWKPLLRKHNATLVVVEDGNNQEVAIYRPLHYQWSCTRTTKDVVGEKNVDLICKHNSSCRNLGLAAVARYLKDTDVIMTFDDDVFPFSDNDPIEDHLLCLDQRMPIDWISTMIDPFPRGFPYGVREQAPVMLSHGVWSNVPDLDAPTTLAYTDKEIIPTFVTGVVPRGIYAPICGMNLAFNIAALPYLYWAPTSTFKGAERFDDIWMGIHAIRHFAKLGWAIYTGGAVVEHRRASDVWANLSKEVEGLAINERYWEDGWVPEEKHEAFFREYDEKRKRWADLIGSFI